MNKGFVQVGLVICLGTTWGCGGRVTSNAPIPSPPPAATSQPAPPPVLAETAFANCGVIPEPGAPISSVALGERVNSANAPHPTNESERLLFRQLYETLVRVDCEGRIAPGLADSWALDPSGVVWTVTLRSNPLYSDGSPVTAPDVVSSWMRGSDLRPEVRRLLRSALAIDDRRIEITLRSQTVAAPLALAHADLAIARRIPGSPWPLGTRNVSVVAGGAASAAPSVITLTSDLRFVIATGRDARDLLDEGVDLLLTREPAALEYAATLPQFASVPLAWQQTRVLLAPRVRPSLTLSAEERDALAMDAIRGEARGALGPFWWQSLSGCDVSFSPLGDQSPSARIVYDAADGAARDLAERFVGLRTYQSAAALTGEALATARRRGNDAGYILSLDRRPLDPCREMQMIVETIGWVVPETIAPLVDTRLQAIVRRGRSGLIAEWDGGLLLEVDSR